MESSLSSQSARPRVACLLICSAMACVALAATAGSADARAKPCSARGSTTVRSTKLVRAYDVFNRNLMVLWVQAISFHHLAPFHPLHIARSAMSNPVLPPTLESVVQRPDPDSIHLYRSLLDEPPGLGARARKPRLFQHLP